MIRFGSVCSGIEAASVAWHPLGWRASFLSEIEAFPRAVLQARFPDVPLHGDFTTIEAGQYEPIDLLVGGTPCQSFSVAGLRGGLGDDRGNLALEYLRLARRLRPRWLVWENVPGVFSLGGGRDFGAILGGMVECGYGLAWRILDAQYFGVPQHRRRVFVVGHLGDWRPAGAVLLEAESLRRDSPPRREAGQEVAGTLKACAGSSGTPNGAEEASRLIVSGAEDIALCLNTKTGRRLDPSLETYVAHSLRGEGFDASEDGTGRGVPIIPIVFDPGKITNPTSGGAPAPGKICHTLNASFAPMIAFNSREDPVVTGAIAGALGASSPQAQAIASSAAVRRLTPRECERLQGFPDDWTRIPVKVLAAKPETKHFQQYADLYEAREDGSWVRYAADGPRYKALGNSMAVPVMRWIGERIQQVDGYLAARVGRAA